MSDGNGQHRIGHWLGSSYGRVTIAILLILVGYVLLSLYFVRSYTERLYEVRKDELRRIVEMGLAGIDPERQSARTSVESMEELRREAAITLRELTYRYRLGENYLFMVTNSGVVLVQPFQPEIEFTDQYDLQDSNGKPFIQEMITVASQDGQGYVEYRYPPPNSNTPERKISYVVAVPEWDALIGAGMYLDDIDADIRRYVATSMLLALGVFLLIFSIILVALRPTAMSYNTLLTLFEAVQRSPGTLPDVPLDRFREGSEAHHLLAGFQSMLQRIERTQKAREEAALAERSRLARELHDAVSQTLFSASLIADVLPRLWDRDPDIAHERLHELRELTRGALGEMRTLLVELRPAALVKADLTELITQLADAVVGRARLPVEVTFEGNISPPVDVKIALYRIVQEALNNVVKHARASEATLSLRADTDGTTILRISDDGRGFDLEQVPAGSFGLGIMEERATAIGADLSIESHLGTGTVVTVTWQGSDQPTGEKGGHPTRIRTH